PGASPRNKAFSYPLAPAAFADPTAVFMPLSEYGHIIPTIKLALRMKRDGWRIVYLVDDKYIPFIESRGLEARSVEMPPAQRARLPRAFRSVEQFEKYTALRRRALEELRPTLLLVDIFESMYALPALELGIRVSTYTIL